MIEHKQCVRIKCNGLLCERKTEWFHDDPVLIEPMQRTLANLCNWVPEGAREIYCPECQNQAQS